MKDGLDVEGLFWLPQSPDDRVGGRLRFTASSGGELQLIGSLSSQTGLLDDYQIGRIYGLAGQRVLTLQNCSRKGQIVEPGLSRETYSVSTVFAGKASLSDPLLFSLMHIEIDHLEDWVGASLLKQAGIFDKIPLSEGPITLQYLKPLQPAVTSEHGTCQLLGTVTYDGRSIARKVIDLHAVLSIQFNQPVSFREVKETALSLQALVSVALDTPLSIKRLLVFEDEPVEPDRLVFDRLNATEIYSSFRGLETSISKEYYHPSEMLFAFENINGFSGIFQWLEVYRKYRLVVDMTTSHWYSPKLYAENRFTNALIASEALIRMEEQRQQISYSNKIKQRISGIPLFADILPDTNSWVEEVTQTRRDLVIHPGLQGEPDPWRLHVLAESLYFLVVILLLKKCGLPEPVFSEMANHRRYIWLSHQLQQEDNGDR